ncbi:carboxypeptidase-like regulatory domain-containing protein [Burkholderia ubonensis]|uniref:carboxypeptidase-like regulatory domain-containing protein n=1 Tax=Burkholderia ubonensis TaxID=101571 RepID=UPI0012FBDAF4|nr:carboxypeptidase-like regulatory domain-containing protein [Burkholderia ubonensis]
MNDAPLGGAAATKQSATLVVMVLGNHHPIANADVQVSAKAPSSESQDLHRMTDANGRASFASIATGAFTVRVIATGWKTTKPLTTLKAGDNQLTIELEAEASQPE